VEVRAEAAAVMNHLNTMVIGHHDLKRGLVLGLISREHVYIEGERTTPCSFMIEECLPELHDSVRGLG
jgi:hypothetical protein